MQVEAAARPVRASGLVLWGNFQPVHLLQEIRREEGGRRAGHGRGRIARAGVHDDGVIAPRRRRSHRRQAVLHTDLQARHDPMSSLGTLSHSELIATCNQLPSMPGKC